MMCIVEASRIERLIVFVVKSLLKIISINYNLIFIIKCVLMNQIKKYI